MLGAAGLPLEFLPSILDFYLLRTFEYKRMAGRHGKGTS